MAGKTGYTEVTNAMPPEGPDQINDVYEHFDALTGETVTTASNLPASGNWLNRTIMATDTKERYVCVALPGTWKKLPNILTQYSGVLVGTAYDGVSPQISKKFTAVSGTDATGWLVIPWPGGVFPNGLISVTMTPGDTTSGFVSAVMRSNTSLINLSLYAYNGSGAPIVNQGIRVNVNADGW